MAPYKVWVYIEIDEGRCRSNETTLPERVGCYTTKEAAKELYDKILEIGVDDVRQAKEEGGPIIPEEMIPNHAELAFRKLRDAWFYAEIASYPGEREWEDEDRELSRERGNNRAKGYYDAQTEEILKGIDRPIAPTCEADFY